MNPEAFDICIRGGGAVARSLALSLSMQGWRVALSGPVHPSPALDDIRTYALNSRSVRLLERLKVWEPLQAFATPVHDMAIQGDAGARLGFSAWQQRVQELAWIVDAAALERLLGEALRYAPHVTLLLPPSDSASPLPEAALLAVCEGKHSATRAALGVSWQRHDYGHWGVAARFSASRPHLGVARQWFRSPDVLALLPFHAPTPGASYGLVWSVPEARARELLALPPLEFTAVLEQALLASDPHAADVLGTLTLSGPPAAWPLAISRPDRWSGPGWVLLGDAAHQVHPLAGQGLNLGLADVDTLSSLLAQSRRDEPWRSPGDERLLRRFERERWWPTQSMGQVTDGLLHLFSQPHPWVRGLRNRGMSLLDRSPPLKRWLIGHALDP